MVLQDPSASTAGKVLAVVGVGTILKAAKTGSALLKAVVGGAEVVGGRGKLLPKVEPTWYSTGKRES